MNKKNILLVLTEDVCSNFGCYGDANAKTPRIDEFAKENIRYTYCSSIAPVCSAARTTLNLGMRASCAGVGHHRSYSAIPNNIKTMGQYLQSAGYYTAIGKTDFNFITDENDGDGYDIVLQSGHTDCEDFANDFIKVMKSSDKPKFILHTAMCTHQSQYGYTDNAATHRLSMPRLQEDDKQNRDDIIVPDYHFNTCEAREIWAQYHEKITTTDRMFGELIDKLKENNCYDDSVIIFIGDNGHGIPSGKCHLWDEGVHVPFIMHLPQDLEPQLKDIRSDKYGKYTDNLTSFLDISATVLSLAGVTIPEHYQGHSLLNSDANDSIYSFNDRIDEICENSRCVRTKDFLYIVDFAYTEFKRLNAYQVTTSPWFIASQYKSGYAQNINETDRRALYRNIPRISEQLFCLKSDKAQLDNLVYNTDYQTKLAEMRKKMCEYIIKTRDSVFMPEPMVNDLIAKTRLTAYEILQDDTLYPVKKLVALWEDLITEQPIPAIRQDDNPCVQCLLIKFLADNERTEEIKPFVFSDNETIRTYTAYRLKNYSVIKEIVQKTCNFSLLFYMTDLIATWDIKDGIQILDVLVKRFFINKEFYSTIGERYIPPMTTSLNLLMHKFKYDLSDVEEQQKWSDREVLAADLVEAATQTNL